MRLYKVRVRRWHRSERTGELKNGVWCDERCLIEADNIAQAQADGFEHLMASKFFGVPTEECQVMETSSVTLPYNL